MTVQEHDSGDLRSLADAMNQLAEYTAGLEGHAEGAAYALAGSWKGMASGEFIQLVGLWSAGASTLRQGAVDLARWASGAADTYDAAQEAAHGIWQG